MPTLGTHAVAITGASRSSALFLRITRATSGIYVMFSASEVDPVRVRGRLANAHTSWHSDGRYHQKSHNQPFGRSLRQRLDSFVGSEVMIQTALGRAGIPGLPACQAEDFDSVMEIPITEAPEVTGDVQVEVDLADALGSAVEPVFDYQLLHRWSLPGAPVIWVSVNRFDFSAVYRSTQRQLTVSAK